MIDPITHAAPRALLAATRFERVDCLVEMGEWMTGRGLNQAGADYLRSALDLLYDVEEKHVGDMSDRACIPQYEAASARERIV